MNMWKSYMWIAEWRIIEGLNGGGGKGGGGGPLVGSRLKLSIFVGVQLNYST